MRHGFRWTAALLVLALVLPSAAGALPAPKTSSMSEGWNPWSRIVAFVAALVGGVEGKTKPKPQADTGCGIDGTGAPKCDS